MLVLFILEDLLFAILKYREKFLPRTVFVPVPISGKKFRPSEVPNKTFLSSQPVCYINQASPAAGVTGKYFSYIFRCAMI